MSNFIHLLKQLFLWNFHWKIENFTFCFDFRKLSSKIKSSSTFSSILPSGREAGAELSGVTLLLAWRRWECVRTWQARFTISDDPISNLWRCWLENSDVWYQITDSGSGCVLLSCYWDYIRNLENDYFEAVFDSFWGFWGQNLNFQSWRQPLLSWGQPILGLMTT